MADFHPRDRYYLASFGGDMESAQLAHEYEKYRKAWKKSQQVGELPVAINLMLSVRFPKMETPATEKKKLEKAKV